MQWRLSDYILFAREKGQSQPQIGPVLAVETDEIYLGILLGRNTRPKGKSLDRIIIFLYLIVHSSIFPALCTSELLIHHIPFYRS